MTAEHDTGGAAAGAPGDEQSKAGRVADTTMTEASNVASAATQGARNVASEAGAQGKAVASEAKQQLDRLVTQGRDEVRLQAEQRSSQAAGQLRTLAEHFSALVEGRPGDAGPLVGYVNDLRHQLGSVAARLEQGGPQGIVNDLTRFARRRPGLFLAGAASMGFVVGRVVRAGAASGHDDGQRPDDRDSTEMAPVGARQPTPVSRSRPGDAVTSPPDGPALGEPTPLPPPTSPEGTGP
jgi:hypothetical protein